MRRIRLLLTGLLALAEPFSAWANGNAASAAAASASAAPAAASAAGAAPAPVQLTAFTLAGGLAVVPAPAAVPLSVLAPPALVQPAAAHASDPPKLAAEGYVVTLALPQPAAAPALPEPRWRPIQDPARGLEKLWRHVNRKLGRDLGSPRRTTEDHMAFESLQQIHGYLTRGSMQEALDRMEELFTGKRARDWYHENEPYRPYLDQAMGYYRHLEREVLGAYRNGFERSGDPELKREALAGLELAGRAYRPTAIQEKDSPWCVYHALHNAITASVGFAEQTSITDLIGYASRLLDRDAPNSDPEELRKLERAIDMKLRTRAADGLGSNSTQRLVESLGGAATRGPMPAGEAELNRRLDSPAGLLLSWRMFHPKYAHDERERALKGHDYRVVHHETYLLGSFLSPSLGRRLYMVQDSGSGRTLFLTFEELRSLTQEVQAVRFTGPVVVPDRVRGAP